MTILDLIMKHCPHRDDDYFADCLFQISYDTIDELDSLLLEMEISTDLHWNLGTERCAPTNFNDKYKFIPGVIQIWDDYGLTHDPDEFMPDAIICYKYSDIDCTRMMLPSKDNLMAFLKE